MFRGDDRSATDRGAMNRAPRTVSQDAGQAGFGLVEALLAAIILAFGLLAVAGLTMTTAGHERLARWQTDQAMAAQLALAEAHQADFDSVASRKTTIEVGGHSYGVAITVTDVSVRVKQVSVEVEGVGPLDARTYTTRLYAPRQLPGPAEEE